MKPPFSYEAEESNTDWLTLIKAGAAIFVFGLVFGPLTAHGAEGAPAQSPPVNLSSTPPLGDAAQGGQPAEEPLEVKVNAETQVSGDTYTLGEIAAISGGDGSLRQQLAAIPMGKSPLPGRALRLNHSFLMARLTGIASQHRLNLEMADSAQVVRAFHLVGAEVIGVKVLEQAARDTLGESPETDPENLKQELATPINAVLLPKGEITWQITRMGRNASETGNLLYQVAALVNGEEAWRYPVRVRQKVVRRVVVLKRAVRRGEVLEAKDVTLEETVMRGNKHNDYLTDPARVVGKKAARTLGEDTPLQPDMLDRQLAVREGGKVTLTYRTSAVTLSVPGVAMVDGEEGAFIPARNLQSGKVVYGILVDNNTVKVN
ncbi:MAG: flagellar basal body P-ring formation chaperone FlgA [Deltaproteobacteria bacterium]|nr:flagellar basal body P-ring formation chaperone FlgA [Deltaproteobacteria bacterium]